MFDPITIIKSAGLIGIYSIIFIESGLLVGFFLPGDTLLFAAGIFASQGIFPLGLLIFGCILAAILGDNVGYWTGNKFGRKLFEREHSTFFNKEKLLVAEKFYKKYGAITIILSRFIPIIRTFAPVVAGVAKMSHRTFFIYNIIGGVLWITSITLLGFYFGSLIPNIDTFLMPIFLLVILFSFLPFISKFVYKLIKNIKK
jgi:membrane-associated protein